MQTTNNNLKDFQLDGNTKGKAGREYGEKIVADIEDYINTSYFKERNERFKKNRALAAGKMDMSIFEDMLDMKTGTSYANINWKAIMIVNTIISRLVGRWMQRSEKAEVTAVDPASVKKKKQERDVAEFLLEEKEFLQGLEKEAGVPVIPKDQFVPEDKDQLDIWAHEEQRLPEEIAFERGINSVYDKNGFGDGGVSKRKIKHDSAEVGLVGTYTYADANGKIHVRPCIPENMIYSYSEYDDFRDTTYRGETLSMKLSELREEYGDKITEKELFEIASEAKEWKGNHGLSSFNDSWNTSFSRPYDEWNVEVVSFELRSYDTEIYNMKVTQNGSLLVEKDREKSKLNGDVSHETKTKWNIYKGVFVKNSKFILEWGLKKNPVNPQDKKYINDKEFSYTFYMYQNRDMRNIAVPEKVEEPVEQMILARLKVQQLVANMRVSGLQIDIDGWQGLDLGTGEGVLKPMQLRRIYDQKGDVYYRGRDAEGNRIESPVKELPNTGGVAQLESLIATYNWHYQILKDELGEDPNLMQQASTPRVTEGNIQVARQEADNATDHMNNACIDLMEETASKIACLLHDSVEFESGQYRELMKTEDVKNRVFDVKIQMLPTEQEVELLMQEVYGYVSTNPDLILYINPFKIRKIAKENLKLAEIYFRDAQRRARKGLQKAAQEQSDYNANAQASSGLQVADAQRKNLELELSVKTQTEMASSKERQKEILLSGLMQIYGKGIPVPQELRMFADEMIKNVALPLFAENAGVEQSAAQQQHPAMQAEGETQPEEEVPQEEQAMPPM